MNEKPTEIDIMGSITEIAEITKAISHEKRLQILTLLLTEAKDFSSLLSFTNLQKTALSNHLAKLHDVQLIKRLERGKYSISSGASSA